MNAVSRRFLAALALLLTAVLAVASALPALAAAPSDGIKIDVPEPLEGVGKQYTIIVPQQVFVGLSQRPTLDVRIEPDDGTFALKFISKDSAICKVGTSTGVLKPYKEGTCTIYVYAVRQNKNSLAVPPVSDFVSVIVTREQKLSGVFQTGEDSLSLRFTNGVGGMGASDIRVSDGDGTQVGVASVDVNPYWDDVLDVTLDAPLLQGVNYDVEAGDQKGSVAGKPSVDIQPLAKPTPNNIRYQTLVMTAGALTEIKTERPTATETQSPYTVLTSANTAVTEMTPTVTEVHFSYYYTEGYTVVTKTDVVKTVQTVPTLLPTLTGTPVKTETDVPTLDPTRFNTLAPTLTRGR